METISVAASSTGFAFIWYITLVYPPTHRILRNKKTYTLFLSFSILTPILAIIAYNDSMLQNRKETSFLSVYLLIFLIMYKYFDNYILKQNNRNLYFKKQYNSVWVDEESDEVTSIEEWIQFALTILPLLLCYILKYIILDVIIKNYF
ncbi:hypothetical protein C8C83_2417 [Flavobacterium sp. 90]|uniref:hypothetical protein n=1 Tax=unclassified Flavobacterium TaxID=196869 RepID=UPI000EB116F2|nr:MULTISPECIES: hypothetical protein [unclassified Flavobacterium]RKR10738.1 hypothetical protein C8C82_2723 [Flavobacterium sp. 81]TCK54521.1 hypothetical protein C8C83_2417 [Flavobacterium sp. 90]